MNWLNTKRRRAVVLAVAFLLSLLVGYGGAAWWQGGVSFPLAGILWGKDHLNILILGTDERGKEQARSDTIILACIDLGKPAVDLVSIPRDTRANIPGHGKEKINHAHTYGGPALLTRTVEGLLGIKVDYYIETNFKGFENIIDLLGGITIDVEKRMYYPEEGIDLKPGLQRLNGHDALGYVRFRHDAMGDIGRVERQQKFVKAAYEQFFTVKNLLKAPQIISQLSQYVKTNMPTSEMLRVAAVLKGMNADQLQTYTLPGYSQTIDGLSYWIAREDEMRRMIAAITAH